MLCEAQSFARCMLGTRLVIPVPRSCTEVHMWMRITRLGGPANKAGPGSSMQC